MSSELPWVVVGPVVAAIILGSIAIATLRQKSHPDAAQAQLNASSEWFDRFQWALEQTSSASEKVQAQGWIALRELMDSPLATDDDLQLLHKVALQLQRDYEGT